MGGGLTQGTCFTMKTYTVYMYTVLASHPEEETHNLGTRLTTLSLSLYLMDAGMRLLHSLCITEVSFSSVRMGRPEKQNHHYGAVAGGDAITM